MIFQSADKAKEKLTKERLKEISKLYEEWADEIERKANYYKTKTAPSYEVKVSRANRLKKMLKSSADNISKEVEGIIKSSIYTVCDDVVKANVDWVNDTFGFDKKLLNVAYNYIPDDVVKKLVTGQVYSSSWSLSKSIWGDNQDTLSKTYKVVAGGLAQNKPIYEIAKDLEQYVRPSAKKPWNLKDKDGRRIYPKQVDYNAQRLARTLVQHGYQQSFVETTQNNPFITDYIWRSNGSRRCEICAARDGKHYKKDELPLDHPNGMCIIEPNVSKSMDDDIINWYKSPDGTYPEIDKFAKELGYEVSSSNVKKIKVAEFTQQQDKLLSKYGYAVENIPEYFDWFIESDYDDFIYLKKLSDNKDMSVEEYYNKYIKKVKYKTKIVSTKKAVDDVISNDDVANYTTWLEKFKKQTEDYMLSKEDKWMGLIGESGIKAIKVYTGSAYQEMNSYLRYIQAGFSEDEAKEKSDISGGYLRYLKDAIEGLNKVKLDEDLVLRRGTNIGDLAGAFMSGDFNKNKELLLSKSVEELNEMFAGSIGRYGAFTSTSSIYDRGFCGDVEVVFYAPKGTSACSIMGISKYGTDEGETLLNVNTTVKCVGVEQSDGHMGSKIRVFLEIIPDD